MKNVGKKILILVLVLGLTVAGILTFYPSIVAPPSEVPMENLHLLTLEKNIVRADIPQYSDSIYRMVEDKLELYLTESYITGQEKDEQTKALIEKYVPTFIDLCKNKFEASQWFDSDHVAMENRIADLRGLTIASESYILGHDLNEELTWIEEVIRDYRKAKEVAKYSSFRNVDDANKKISEAEKYSKKAPLKNCTELVEKLKTVKTRIGDSHYKQVDKEVEKLAKYKSMGKSEWEELCKDVLEMITNYKGIYRRYGHDDNKLRDLNQKAEKYRGEAMEYYTKKIKLDLGGWEEIESYDVNFKMYQSYSNKGVHKGKAYMCLKVSNLTTIRFYIKNDSEYNHDYILVRKGSRPTDNDYTFSSKGKDRSKWTEVEYTNLDPNVVTEIHIMYRKDSSDSYGNDCGIIAIQKDYFNENQ